MSSLSATAYALLFVLLSGPIVVAVSLVVAHRHGRANVTDYASLFFPVFLFFVLGVAREDFRTPDGAVVFIVGFMLIVLASMYLLAAKLLLTDRYTEQPRRTSYVLFAVLTAVATAMPLTLPWWKFW